MLKRFTRKIVLNAAILCLVPRGISYSQDEPKTAKKRESIEVQIKVTDKKTQSAIDNADVQVRWAEGQEADFPSAVTNSKGIARLRDVPRSVVVIRVIANGYKTVAPKFDLKAEEQPIKIELEKETKTGDESVAEPRES